MSEELQKPRTLLSDPKVLHKIKYIQFRRQMIPLAVVLILMVINVIHPKMWLLYPTLAAFGWYLVERILLRTKNKILVPSAAAIVAPTDGKVQSIRQLEGSTVVTIRKSWLDIAELRLPFANLIKERDDQWNFDTPLGRVTLRLNAKQIHYFNDDNTQGSVIGLIQGNALFHLYLPADTPVLVKENESVFGGETELVNFEVEAKSEAKPKSIVLEEMPDMDEVK